MIDGMAIVIFFYVMINVAAYGAVNWADLSKCHAPLGQYSYPRHGRRFLKIVNQTESYECK